MKFKFTLLILLSLISGNIFSSVVSGKITDEKGAPLPFASVFIKNSVTGVSANYNGEYFLELKPGKYILIYTYIGYEKSEKEINLKKDQNLEINIILKPEFNAIDEVEIIADKIDRAKRIMTNVKAKRKLYLNSVNNYTCDIYAKTSFERESWNNDTTSSEINDSTENIELYNKSKLNLIEYIAEYFYLSPDHYKEKILAFHDCSYKKPPGRYISLTIDIDNESITPEQNYAPNPYLFKTDNISNVFNFYKNITDIPELCKQPIKSPISAGSGISYKYTYLESFYENDKKIHKIKVIPLFKQEALYKGNLFIEDSTWALTAVDLSVNENALIMHKNFRIIINYIQLKENVYLPSKLNIVYTIKDGKSNILGETKLNFKNYSVNSDDFNSKFIDNEVKSFAPDAYDKDSAYWSRNRMFELKKEELEFIYKTDSVQNYYASNEYLDKQDSIFNRFYWYSPLVGYGRKNHYKGTEYFVGGLIQQIVPFGVGGYRHRLPVYFNKEFKNSYLLETNVKIDYGFKNKDIKGKLGLGLTYFPKKFIRTYVEVGNTYDLINNYASVEQIFSRSNYANTKSAQIKQRMEIFNGMFAELSLYYSKQIPIIDLQLSKWSDFVFGDLNEPIEFERYIKSELKLKLNYRLNQKYYLKGNKKVILGGDYTEFLFTYRKGIPKLFNSEVNFDYIELGAKSEHQVARLGNFRWEAKIGLFANKSSLRILEYKYFRGSDKYFFSDPLRSFQLLGPTLNTNYSFWQANYMHHFNGAILSKIPLINRLNISLAGGVGTLNIPQSKFYHFEMFAGFEKVIKIRKDLYKIGIYGVTSDNTLSKTSFTFKVGFNFFNAYNRKWLY